MAFLFVTGTGPMRLGWIVLAGAGVLLVASRHGIGGAESPKRVYSARPASVANVARGGRSGLLSQPPALALTASASAGNPDEFEFGPMAKIRTLNAGGGYETIEAVAVGDVTGDRRDDIVVQPYTNVLRVYVQRPDGSLAPAREFRYRSDDNYLHRKNMVLADFNGDGVLDVAASGIDENSWYHGQVNLLLSGPNGTLAHRKALTTVERPADHWRALDVDGDGALDIVASENVSDYSGGTECGAQRSACPRLRVMYGDGRGDFTRIETVIVGEPHGIHLLPPADVDGDGRRDITYSLNGDPFKPGKVVARAIRAGGGIGPPVTLFPHDIAFDGLIPADYTGDGRVDFVGSNILHARQADGAFAQTLLPAGTIRSHWNAAADFDGDGKADYATVQMINWTMYVVLYQQRDGGLKRHVFSAPYFELDKVSPWDNALATGDVDGDGCRDLVVSASYEGVLIFPGSKCLQPVAPTAISCDLREPVAASLTATAPPSSSWSAGVNRVGALEASRGRPRAEGVRNGGVR